MKDIENKLKELNFNNFKLLKGRSSDVINTLPELENVVCFIDGDHSYNAVKADFNSIIKKIKNGYIIFDDLNWTSVDRFFSEIENNYKVVFKNYRAGVIKIS